MTNMEAALQALKDGIIVKRYAKEGGFNAFFGDELYIVFYKGGYQLGVTSRQGYLAVEDYGKVWMLRPKNIYDLTANKTEAEEDVLFRELFEENFGA